MTPSLYGRLHCFAIPRRDLSVKKTNPNTEIYPENLGVMLEFYNIERNLVPRVLSNSRSGRRVGEDLGNEVEESVVRSRMEFFFSQRLPQRTETVPEEGARRIASYIQ